MKKFGLIVLALLCGVLMTGTGCQKEETPKKTLQSGTQNYFGKSNEHKTEKNSRDAEHEHGEDCDHGNEKKADGHEDDEDDHGTDEEHTRHEEHDGEDEDHDDHDNDEKLAKHDEHEDDDDKGHDDHSDHSDREGEIHLSDKAIELAGIKMALVSLTGIAQEIELSGEIGYNENQIAHITPRFGGVVRDIHKQLGQYVDKGERLATIESNASLSNYLVRAPIAGWIVERHATPGEFASEETAIFTVANLGTVWANCEVFAKDAEVVKRGLPIFIKAVGTDRHIKSTLSYVAPVYNETTRSIIARATIPNRKNAWRPGTFITGIISQDSDTLVPSVAKNAVQVLHDETVVFVPEEGEKNAFIAVAVTTGLANDTYVEIISGLKAGDMYVAKGAFEIKAKIITSSLGDHAGHGH